MPRNSGSSRIAKAVTKTRKQARTTRGPIAKKVAEKTKQRRASAGPIAKRVGHKARGGGPTISGKKTLGG